MMFGNAYANKKIFITGHTGFKGAWLCLWLKMLGAEVAGFSLPPHTVPSHFPLLNLKIMDLRGDIRGVDRLTRAIGHFEPDAVFHLAAQALVRTSYESPSETFSTNVMGTVNLLESCRNRPGIKAVINVTSDKCYENVEKAEGYREDEPMGGHDPYSASKGCSELVTSSYRRSFFSESDTLLASTRAGNAIGGGDWSEDRIIPDLVRAAIEGQTTAIRNPGHVRPWQHVLEPLAGYLELGAKLMQGDRQFAQAWNFGPNSDTGLTVLELAELAHEVWPEIKHENKTDKSAPHEAGLLALNISKAREKLDWRPVWDARQAVRQTVDWYKNFYEKKEVISRKQIEQYVGDAQKAGISWAGGSK